MSSPRPTLLICILIAHITAVAGVEPVTDPVPPQVLLINSYHHGYLWTDEITRGVQDTLDGAELHIEYLDTKRVFDANLLEQLAGVLQHKHQHQRFAAVIVSDNNAFDFFSEHGARILPDTPMVFCGINGLAPDDLTTRPPCTGVNEQADIAGNLRLIRHLHPDCRRVVVVTDTTTTGARVRRNVEGLRPTFATELPQIDILDDLSMTALTPWHGHDVTSQYEH